MAADSVENNLVLVEGKNDKFFVEALIAALNINNLRCENLDGMGHLRKKLNAVQRDKRKGTVKKIGIIFDADLVEIPTRETEIDEVIKSVFGTEVSNFSKYILNVDGKGELCTLLRVIKKNESPKADCLDAWASCVAQSNETIPKKEIDKIWMNLYHTYDCSTVQERKNGAKNCNLKTMLTKGMYDLHHAQLQEIRNFLTELEN